MPTSIDTIRYYTDIDGNFIKVLRNAMPWRYTIPVLRESHLFMATASLFDRHKPSSPEDAKRRFKVIIQALKERCKDRQVPITFFLIPEKPSSERLAAAKVLHRATIAIMEQTDSSFIDLGESLNSDSYFRDDMHFNEAGNRVTFDIAADVFRHQLGR